MSSPHGRSQTRTVAAGRPVLVVMAKPLVAGRVKTRLAATIGADAALGVYRRLLESTVAQAEKVVGVSLVLAFVAGPGGVQPAADPQRPLDRAGTARRGPRRAPRRRLRRPVRDRRRGGRRGEQRQSRDPAGVPAARRRPARAGQDRARPGGRWRLLCRGHRPPHLVVAQGCAAADAQSRADGDAGLALLDAGRGPEGRPRGGPAAVVAGCRRGRRPARLRAAHRRQRLARRGGRRAGPA